MRRNNLLADLDHKLGSSVSTRRYSLADMISESYRIVYECEEGTNMKRLAESHLEDVKSNPRDIDRLSRQMSIIKELSRMTESGEIKDKDLVEEKACDDADSKKRDPRRSFRRRPTQECNTPKKEIKEADDPELTEEELEELAKHLESIRKQKSPTAPAKEDESCNESVESSAKGDDDRPIYVGDKVSPWNYDEFTEEELQDRKGEVTEISGNRLTIMSPTGREFAATAADYHVSSYGKNHKFTESVEDFDDNKGKKPLTDVKDEIEGKEDRVLGKFGSCNESKSYKDLQGFAKKSSGKAFYKTFKKLSGKLHEGTALTRKETIDLYKAANSAMTQMSVELEHNPEFLGTFKESVSILSGDVSRLLESISNDKAPSKKNMKSLAKFSEALLYEAEDDEDEITDDVEDDVAMDPEAEEVPAEEEDFVGDDEGDIESEEADSFDQEYADARVELHKELVANHEEDEDPAIQEKIAQDKEEVVNLPGITDEQIAEITGEETPVEEPEESPEGDDIEDEPEEEEADEVEDDSEITDDELAELKNHLKEMRAARKMRESAEDVESALAKVTDALKKEGIRYSMRGKRRDYVLVSRKDLERASQINRELGTSGLINVAHPA